jgi:hypothetical protein
MEWIWSGVDTTGPSRYEGHLGLSAIQPLRVHGEQGLRQRAGGPFHAGDAGDGPSDPLAAEAMRLEGARRWVTGSHEGFRERLKALDEPPACCSSVCDSSDPGVRFLARSKRGTRSMPAWLIGGTRRRRFCASGWEVESARERTDNISVPRWVGHDAICHIHGTGELRHCRLQFQFHELDELAGGVVQNFHERGITVRILPHDIIDVGLGSRRNAKVQRVAQGLFESTGRVDAQASRSFTLNFALKPSVLVDGGANLKAPPYRSATVIVEVG